MKLSMMHKMLLWILLPVILGMAAISYMDYKDTEEVLESQIRNDLQTVLSTQIGVLRSVQQTLNGGLRAMTQLISFQNLARGTAANLPESELAPLRQKASTVAAALVKDYAMISCIAFIDAKGTVQAHNEPRHIGNSYADRRYFQQAMRTNDVQVQNVISRADGTQATVMGVAMKDEAGKNIGVVMLTMDNAAFADMTTSQLKIGSRSLCYVYDIQGEIVLHPDRKLLGRKDAELPHVRHMLQTKQGRTTYMDNGEQRILYYESLPSMNWLVVIDISRDELFAPLDSMLSTSLMVLSAFVLLVGVIIFYNLRSVASCIHICAQIAQHVAAGVLAFTPAEAHALKKAAARNDELSILATSFQSMRDNLERLLQESSQKAQEATAAMEKAQQAQGRGRRGDTAGRTCPQ